MGHTTIRWRSPYDQQPGKTLRDDDLLLREVGCVVCYYRGSRPLGRRQFINTTTTTSNGQKVNGCLKGYDVPSNCRLWRDSRV